MRPTRRTLLSLLPGVGLLKPRAVNGQRAPADPSPISTTPQTKPLPEGSASGYPVQFVDVAKQAGLTHTVYYGEVDTTDYITEANGCGVAFYDYDNDGWLDVLILNGSRRGGFPEGREPTNHLYKNNRDGTFTDVTKRAGLLHSGWASGVCIGDYDNDGNDDLFISYRGKNVLYHNNGDGTFTDVTDEAGVGGDPKRWNAGCTFVDYDRDGKLDLFISNYVGAGSLENMPPKGKTSWKGVPVAYGPQGLQHGSHILYHNNGDGTFTDVSEQSGILDATGHGMTALVTDFNDDGWPDIYVACDSSASILYRNNQDGTFSNIAAERGLAYSEHGVAQAGMGLAIADYNGDGKLDVLKTHFADDTPGLYLNDGQGYFSDESSTAGLQGVTRHLQWGTGLADFDNDGWPDLLYVTGHVYPEVEKVNPDYPYKGPRFLFRNARNGTFVNVTDESGPGLTTPHSSRGCAFGDFDNDGDMDILVMNMNEPPSLIRADVKPGNHWLKVKLTGVESNRTAIGARVVIQVGRRLQAQEVHSQDSYFSVNDLRLHFGLGQARGVNSIRVYWPSGKRETMRNVEADQLVYIEEGRGIVRTQKFD
jgi:hypothetical protein